MYLFVLTIFFLKKISHDAWTRDESQDLLQKIDVNPTGMFYKKTLK